MEEKSLLSVNLTPESKKEIVKAEEVVKLYNEVLDDIRDDRREIDETLKNYLEMALNGGDNSNSTKETIVNLFKLRSDAADKKTRIMSLLLGSLMHEPSAKYVAANVTQQNFNVGNNKRKLISTLNDKSS